MSASAQLIERLKKATGPDRELDALVYCAVQEWVVHPEHGFPIEIWAVRDCIFWKGGTVTQGPLHLDGFGFPRYTASIDGALTLVPEGFVFYVSNDDTGKGCHACVWTNEPKRSSGAHAATTVIALCIAALKARSAA